MSATMNSPWPPWMLEPGPWWPWPPQGLLPLPVPVMLGGTGVTTVAGARESLGIDAAIQAAVQAAIDALPPGQSITLPLTIAEGGTGATTAAGAPWLPLAGGTVSGTLLVTGDATFYGMLDLGVAGQLRIDGGTGVPIVVQGDGSGNLTVFAPGNVQLLSPLSTGTLNIDGPLFVTDGTVLQPVSIGAADTGDTGFRVLQVPN